MEPNAENQNENQTEQYSEQPQIPVLRYCQLEEYLVLKGIIPAERAQFCTEEKVERINVSGLAALRRDLEAEGKRKRERFMEIAALFKKAPRARTRKSVLVELVTTRKGKKVGNFGKIEEPPD